MKTPFHILYIYDECDGPGVSVFQTLEEAEKAMRDYAAGFRDLEGLDDHEILEVILGSGGDCFIFACPADGGACSQVRPPFDRAAEAA